MKNFNLNSAAAYSVCVIEINPQELKPDLHNSLT